MRSWILIVTLVLTAAAAHAQTATLALDTRVPLVDDDSGTYDRRGLPLRVELFSGEQEGGGGRWGMTMTRSGADYRALNGNTSRSGAFSLAFALDWPLVQAGDVTVRWGLEAGMLWVGRDGGDTCDSPFCGLPDGSAVGAAVVRAARPLNTHTAVVAELRYDWHPEADDFGDAHPFAGGVVAAVGLRFAATPSRAP